MKGIQIHSFGDPEDVLEVARLDEPSSPGDGQALVGVEYSPLNIHDLYFIGGHLGTPPLPAVPGNEGVGRVLDVGPGVTNVQPRDRIVLPLLSGAWRERLVILAANLFPLPETDPQQLSMLGSNPPAAGLILSEYTDLEAGAWVAQDAANGGVGRSLIALAHLRGFRTINLVRNASQIPELRAMGADVVVLDGPTAVREIRDQIGDAEIRLAADSIGGPTAQILLDLLAPGGTVVTYGDASGHGFPADSAAVVEKSLIVSGIFVGAFDNASKIVPVVAETAPLIASGRLHVPVAAVYDLDDVRQAVARVRQGGKVLLRVGSGT